MTLAGTPSGLAVAGPIVTPPITQAASVKAVARLDHRDAPARPTEAVTAANGMSWIR